MKRVICVGVLSILVVFLSFSAPVQAITRYVENTDDSGTGSLRQAIADAVDGDRIEFNVDGTITLTTYPYYLALDKSITIDATGHSITIDANHQQSSAFRISGGSPPRPLH